MSVPRFLQEAGVNVLTEKDATLITPALAESLIGRNERNRIVRVPRVETLALAMTRGEWRFNGDSISIGTDGLLKDGQHRLHACLKSGVSFLAFVVLVEPEAQMTMDVGFKRQWGDELRMRGEKYYSDVAATCVLLWNWEQRGWPSAQNTTVPATFKQLDDLLERRPSLRDSVARTAKKSMRVWGTPSFLAAHHYIFVQAEPEDGEIFFRRLENGSDEEGQGLPEGDPIHTLRERLIVEKAGKRGQLHARLRSFWFHRAFKAWINGERLLRLQVSGTRTTFPTVDPVSMDERET